MAVELCHSQKVIEIPVIFFLPPLLVEIFEKDQKKEQWIFSLLFSTKCIVRFRAKFSLSIPGLSH
jgi:hypothetical protein